MFRARTVLVLGAGASTEVGLPTGDELLRSICRLVDIRYDFSEMKSGDNMIAQALKMIIGEGREVSKFNDHLRSAWQIVSSSKQAISTDNIVDALEDQKIELVAKLGIVRAIHEAEKKSAFFKTPDNRPDSLALEKFDTTWYSSLTKLLCEGRRKSDINNIFENLSIVNFNYDRCVECYLPHSISNYYGTRKEVVIDLMPKLRIHRPYGIAGRLPWQSGNGAATPFGGSGVESLIDAAGGIRTFTQGVEDPSSLDGMKKDISSAERIVFLGFAFHRQNVQLLSSSAGSVAQILATAKSIPDSDKAVISGEVGDAFELSADQKDNIVLSNFYCHDFFKIIGALLPVKPRPRGRTRSSISSEQPRPGAQ